MADALDAPLLSISDSALLAEMDDVFACVQRLSARFLAQIQQAHHRGIPADQAAASTRMWLATRFAMSIGEATGLTRLAAELPARPRLAEALAAGAVNVEQAQVIARTVAALPAAVGPAGKARAEEVLTRIAQEDKARPEVLARHRAALLEMVAPELAEKKEREDLERADRTAYARRAFTLVPDEFGGYRVRGLLDSDSAAYVRAAIDALSAPGSRASSVGPFSPESSAGGASGAGHAGGDAVGSGGSGGSGLANGSAEAAGLAGGAEAVDDAVRDRRSAAARRADALTFLCKRALDDGELPVSGGERPHLAVTLSWQQLRDQLGHGLLDTGDRLTPETVRRLACDATIIPMVLGGAGQVLDVGRARRLIDGPLRRALCVRDGGCAFPGCDRPPRWCDGHHIVAWADGGPTALDNSVLLCGFHHREIHRTAGRNGAWKVRMAPDGYPEFVPPRHLDPQQRPRRNVIHRRT